MDTATALARIEAAFADAPRPTNDDLLHPQCMDDMDVADVYDVAHWRDMEDADVVYAYAALSGLSPEGFRHFVPAYLSYALRNPDAPEVVVDSAVWAFHLAMYPPDLRDFVRSKWACLDTPQREAVAAFLEAMDAAGHEDAAAARAAWEV